MELEKLKYPIGQCVYQEDYTENELKEFILNIETFPKRLEFAVQSLLEFQLNTPYREGGWTINQVIHHCADSHMNCLIRIKLALTEDNPTIKPYIESLWAETPDYNLPFNNSITILFAIHLKIIEIYLGLDFVEKCFLITILYLNLSFIIFIAIIRSAFKQDFQVFIYLFLRYEKNK
jgi:hypothetical protein